MLRVHSKNTNVLFFIFWHHHCPRYLKAARWALNRFMYWLALPTRNGSVYPLGLLSSDRFYSCSMSVYPIKTITIMMTSMISILFMNVVFFQLKVFFLLLSKYWTGHKGQSVVVHCCQIVRILIIKGLLLNIWKGYSFLKIFRCFIVFNIKFIIF